MDSSILRWLAAHRGAALDRLMLGVTLIGGNGAIWLALAIVGLLRGRSRAMAAWQAIVAVLLAWLVTDAVLKPLVHRPRPYSTPGHEVAQVLFRTPSTYSFPSGHAATSVAGAYALGVVWPAARPALWALAVLVSLSRLYLGVHYPSDVLAGALLGWLIAWFVRGGSRWSP